MKKTALVQKRYHNSEFYKFLLESEDARSVLNAKQALLDERKHWGGVIDAVPAGTFLDEFIRQVYETSEIQLEVPFSAGVAYISAYLLHKGVKIEVEGDTMGPDLWLLLLAPSGSGKTFVINLLKDYLGKDVVPMLPECQSDAAFIEALSENNNSLWCRDEFGQLMKGLEKPGPQEKMRDYLLRTFDNSDIEYRTKKNSFTVENAALTIYGGSVYETWNKCVSAESMLDGFGQRFAYVVAGQVDDPEEHRRFENNAFWRTKQPERKQAVAAAWDKLTSVPLQPVYKVSAGALDAFEAAFKSLWGIAGSRTTRAFFRRILFRSFKYSLLFHFLLGKASDEIDEQDMGWAIRAAKLHLKWLFEVMDLFETPELEKKVKQVEGAITRLEAKGIAISPRTIRQYVKSVKTGEEAEAILKLLEGRK